jgi:hypothetical protein
MYGRVRIEGKKDGKYERGVIMNGRKDWTKRIWAKKEVN